MSGELSPENGDPIERVLRECGAKEAVPADVFTMLAVGRLLDAARSEPSPIATEAEELREALRREAIAKAALSRSQTAAWRPIETAPKDGTIIDVWRHEGGRDTVFWGYPHHDCGEMGRLCDSEWHSIRAPGWVCNTFGEFLGRKHAPFTHWMPLPAAPDVLALSDKEPGQ